jgi:hypothetical protein
MIDRKACRWDPLCSSESSNSNDEGEGTDDGGDAVS